MTKKTNDETKEKKQKKEPIGPAFVVLLTQQLRKSAALLTHTEVRFLVDTYYALQKYRIGLASQQRSDDQGVDDQPATLLEWLLDNVTRLERQIHGALVVYAESHPLSRWAMKIPGIGPVLAAGLLAHIDPEEAKTPGNIYSFAGLVPGVKWERGKLRPWNARLRTLCWKIGDSFVKVSNKEDDIYGHLYRQRKELEVAANEAGERAAEAQELVANASPKYKKTDAYKLYNLKGKLSPGHVDARARRWAVKIFLSHWWEQMYRIHYKREPPFQPYPFDRQGHAHKIETPFRDIDDGEASTGVCAAT